jgi:hypothetical protein
MDWFSNGDDYGPSHAMPWLLKERIEDTREAHDPTAEEGGEEEYAPPGGTPDEEDDKIYRAIAEVSLQLADVYAEDPLPRVDNGGRDFNYTSFRGVCPSTEAKDKLRCTIYLGVFFDGTTSEDIIEYIYENRGRGEGDGSYVHEERGADASITHSRIRGALPRRLRGWR